MILRKESKGKPDENVEVQPNLSLYLMAATVGMIITLGIIFFLFCCCRKKSTNPIPNLAVVPVKKGKLRSFVDQNHDKITKVAHHDDVYYV